MSLHDVLSWFGGPTGQKVIFGAIIPFLSIVVAAIIGGLVARGAIKRLIARQDRVARSNAIAALVNVARRASRYDALPESEQLAIDRAHGDADIALRLLPVRDADLAADWSQHQIEALKRQSGAFDFRADAELVDFRERLLDWEDSPRRARKIFSGDIARWEFDGEQSNESAKDKSAKHAKSAKSDRKAEAAPAKSSTERATVTRSEPELAPQAERRASAEDDSRVSFTNNEPTISTTTTATTASERAEAEKAAQADEANTSEPVVRKGSRPAAPKFTFEPRGDQPQRGVEAPSDEADVEGDSTRHIA